MSGWPEHTHECRRCGGDIECFVDDTECGWQGDNDGCPYPPCHEDEGR